MFPNIDFHNGRPWMQQAPAIVDNGPIIGPFRRQHYCTGGESIAPGIFGAWTVIYSPTNSPNQDEYRDEINGHVLLFGGAYGNHTTLGELPRKFGNKRWQTDIVPFREWSSPDDADAVRGRWLTRLWMDLQWGEIAEELPIEILLGGPPTGQPLVMGGFSMGGAAAVRSFEAMEPHWRRKVCGLILLAPALDIPLFTGSPLKKFLTRDVLFSGLKLLNRDQKKSLPENLDPALAEAVQVQTRRPMGGVGAAAWFIRKSSQALDRLIEAGGDEVPVLLVHGGDSDKTVHGRSAERIKQAFPNTTEVILDETTTGGLVVPGAGHYVAVSQRREEVHTAVDAFIASNLREPPTPFGYIDYK